MKESTRRVTVLLLVIGLVAASMVFAGRSSAAGSTGIRWLAAGDSYSSGEGLRSASGDCQRSAEAYAPLAHERLAATLDLEPLEFVACTGAVTADFDDQWRAAGGGRFELVTLTFGGNDIGFEGVLRDCIGLDDPLWEIPRCDATEADLNGRIDGLGATLTRLYEHIRRDVLAPDGRLVVIGYPLLFAEPESWSWAHSTRCSAVSRNDVPMLNRLARRLDSVTTSAVAAVPGVHYESVLDEFASHGLCGTGEEWLNGVTTGLTSGTWRLERSFHPKEPGHRGEADRVAAIVEGLGLVRVPPTTSPPSTQPEPPTDLVLLPDRLGPLTVGMSPEEADATGAVTDATASVDESEEVLGYVCGFGEGSGFSAMFDDGGLARFYVESSEIRTPEGIGVGSTEDEVRAAFGTRVVAGGDDFYGHTLTVVDGGHGYVFVLDSPGGTVSTAGAGRADALELVEGCA